MLIAEQVLRCRFKVFRRNCCPTCFEKYGWLAVVLLETDFDDKNVPTFHRDPSRYDVDQSGVEVLEPVQVAVDRPQPLILEPVHFGEVWKRRTTFC